MTRAPDSRADGGLTIVSVAIVADDEPWAETQARGLEAVDGRIQTTVSRTVSALSDAVENVDCAVVEAGSDPEATAERCARVGGDREDLAVVAVVEDGTDPGSITDLSPGPDDVYVRTAGDPRPAALAWRIRAAVRTADLDAQIAAVRDALGGLFAEVPTPLAITDPSGAIERTNPAYKATFGLAERLPGGVPDSGAMGPATASTDGRAAVECETLEGTRRYRYSTVPLDAGRVCHVFRDPPAAETPGPAAAGADDSPAEDHSATTGEGGSDQTPLDGLTDRQREVLVTAHEGGFFERPKGHNSDELAASLGITRSTFLQHLRAAQRKLLNDVLE